MQSKAPFTLILSPLRAGRGERERTYFGSLYGDLDAVPLKVPLSLSKRERVRVGSSRLHGCGLVPSPRSERVPLGSEVRGSDCRFRHLTLTLSPIEAEREGADGGAQTLCHALGLDHEHAKYAKEGREGLSISFPRIWRISRFDPRDSRAQSFPSSVFAIIG